MSEAKSTVKKYQLDRVKEQLAELRSEVSALQVAVGHLTETFVKPRK